MIREYNVSKETKGKWCLPAAGILSKVYFNRTRINEGIAKLGGKKFYSGYYVWSSTVHSDSSVWVYRQDIGDDRFGLFTVPQSSSTNSNGNYDSNHYVWPVLEF